MPLVHHIYRYYVRTNTIYHKAGLKVVLWQKKIKKNKKSCSKSLMSLLVLSRKMLIVVLATFGKADSLQVHYALGFFVAFAAIRVHSDPFESKRSDRFEITSLILLCCLFFGLQCFTRWRVCAVLSSAPNYYF